METFVYKLSEPMIITWISIASFPLIRSTKYFSEIANNYKEFGKPQLQHACSVNTQGFSHDAIAAVVLDSTLSLIHLPVLGHEIYKVTLNV